MATDICIPKVNPRRGTTIEMKMYVLWLSYILLVFMNIISAVASKALWWWLHVRFDIRSKYDFPNIIRKLWDIPKHSTRL